MHQEVLDIGPSESAGKKVSAPTMITVPTSRPTNSGAVRRQGAAGSRNLLLRRQAAGNRQQSG